MVYKRYIKRDGRISGPYYYKSYRDENGKVISKYIGKKLPERAFLNKFDIKMFFSLVVLLLASVFIINYIRTYENANFVGDVINSGCESELEYSNWGECKAVYDLGLIFDNNSFDNRSLLEGAFLRGVRERIISDKNKCGFEDDQIETENCGIKKLIITRKSEKCGINYLEIYDENENLVFKIDLVKGIYGNFSIQAFLDGYEYCHYCYDGIRNFDEDGVDCVYSGESCPICLSGQGTLKGYFIVNLVLFGGIIVFLILFLWYLNVVKKIRKRRNEILGLEFLEETKKFKSELQKISRLEGGKEAGAEAEEEAGPRLEKGKSEEDYELPEIPDRRVKDPDKLKKERLNELRWVQVAVKRNLNREQVEAALSGLDETKKHIMLSDYDSLMSKKTAKERAMEFAWLKKAIKKGLTKEQVGVLLSEVDVSLRKKMLRYYDEVNKLGIEKQIKRAQEREGEDWSKLPLRLKTKNLLNEIDMILEKQREGGI